jgi:hypothetical protein
MWRRPARAQAPTPLLEEIEHFLGNLRAKRALAARSGRGFSTSSGSFCVSGFRAKDFPEYVEWNICWMKPTFRIS